jgi:hypothetical protein
VAEGAPHVATGRDASHLDFAAAFWAGERSLHAPSLPSLDRRGFPSDAFTLHLKNIRRAARLGGTLDPRFKSIPPPVDY